MTYKEVVLGILDIFNLEPTASARNWVDDCESIVEEFENEVAKAVRKEKDDDIEYMSGEFDKKQGELQAECDDKETEINELKEQIEELTKQLEDVREELTDLKYPD